MVKRRGILEQCTDVGYHMIKLCRSFGIKIAISGYKGRTNFTSPPLEGLEESKYNQIEIQKNKNYHEIKDKFIIVGHYDLLLLYGRQCEITDRLCESINRKH